MNNRFVWEPEDIIVKKDDDKKELQKKDKEKESHKDLKEKPSKEIKNKD